MPSPETVESMQQGLKSQKRELILIYTRRLEKLVNLALSGTLRKSILQQREENYLEQRAELESIILETEKKLSKLPTQDELEKDA